MIGYIRGDPKLEQAIGSALSGSTIWCGFEGSKSYSIQVHDSDARRARVILERMVRTGRAQVQFAP